MTSLLQSFTFHITITGYLCQLVLIETFTKRTRLQLLFDIQLYKCLGSDLPADA